MHYISVKQEHGVPGPGQLFDAECYDIADTVVERKKIVEVIDLCDSDSDNANDNAPSTTSSVIPPDSTSDIRTRLNDQRWSNAITSNATGSEADVLQSRRYGRGPTLVSRYRAPTSSKSELLPGTAIPKPIEAVSTTATAPATDVTPIPRSYWQKRLDAPVQLGSSATPTDDTTIVDPSTSAKSPATTSVTGPTEPKTKKRTPNPTPEHPHKYRGPELTVLSLRAIWDHLDQG